MDIIGVGFGRTGTTSIQRAFQQLGYRAYNFEAVIENEHFDLWREIGEGKPADWNTIYDGYNATVSWPSCFYYKELMDVYPNAKFILTTRDPERWAESVMRVLPHFGKLKPFRFIPRVRAMLRLMETTMLPRFGGSNPSKAHLVNTITEHDAAVKAIIPAKKLLVYTVKEGWEPLCAFLQCDVPAGRFPYENRGDDFIKEIMSRFVGSKSYGN